MDLILDDNDNPVTRPLSRFKSIFSLRTGIYTELERQKIKHPGAKLFFRHHNTSYEKLIAAVDGIIPWNSNQSGPNRTISTDELNPFTLLDRIGKQLEADLELQNQAGSTDSFHTGDDQAKLQQISLGKQPVEIVGSPNNFHFHPTVRLMPQVVIDTRNGPVILDEGCEVSSFSLLSGPLYAGKKSRLDSVRLKGGTILGHQVRVGGEIENSIINDFSNKHHEGFLGHSLLGSWVNLGAIVTTSDLKNNYGEIKLELPEDFIPALDNPEVISISSGRNKFGAIIGDCVKIAIGTMLNTGTVIDAGSSIFGQTPGRYTPPLSWGLAGERYELSRFEEDSRRIFARREQSYDATISELARLLNR